jgi:hypothetical protein
MNRHSFEEPAGEDGSFGGLSGSFTINTSSYGGMALRATLVPLIVGVAAGVLTGALIGFIILGVLVAVLANALAFVVWRNTRPVASNNG